MTDRGRVVPCQTVVNHLAERVLRIVRLGADHHQQGFRPRALAGGQYVEKLTCLGLRQFVIDHKRWVQAVLGASFSGQSLKARTGSGDA